MRTPTIDFIGLSRRFALGSIALLLIAVAIVSFRGLDLSIEFVGGVSYTLNDVRDDLTSAELRQAAQQAGAQDVIAQVQMRDDVAIGAIVRTEAMDVGSPESNAVRDALLETAEPSEFAFSSVGPTWGERITRQAIQALIVFIIVIVIYISMRLEFKMAVAAVLALVHDLAITIGLYGAFGFNVSPATVIALLTILGYSLYDTVVVFDRVKDNSVALGEPGRRTYSELVNSSLNEVLYRSINTSVTSLLPVGALLLIGAQVLGATTLQDLALALFIGMAVGIYSSLFVAGPFLAWLKLREPEEARRVAKVAREDAEGVVEPEREQVKAPAAGSPEARAPITTDYVRGQGRGKKRKKGKR
jgi:preprotein translocase subunit SecF